MTEWGQWKETKWLQQHNDEVSGTRNLLPRLPKGKQETACECRDKRRQKMRKNVTFSFGCDSRPTISVHLQAGRGKRDRLGKRTARTFS